MQPVHSLLALLIVWLAMDATVADTNRPPFEVSQRLMAEGFTEVAVDLLKGLSVPHNSVGAITNELKSPPVLDVLTRGLSAQPDIPPRWLVPVTNEPITVRVPAQSLARRGVAAQPGEMVDLKVT
jgi:hypothetical protein